MLANLLKNFYKKINYNSVHNPENIRMPIDEQRKYLQKFAEPKDNYERSFFKFKCFCTYCYYKKKWIILLYNIGAALIYPIIFKILKTRGKKMGEKSIESFDAVIENVPNLRNDDIIPEELMSSLKKIKEIKSIDYKNACLSKNAIEICKNLEKRYFWYFYFRLISMIKIAQFDEYIMKYNPKKIIFYSCEREFSGPLQTLLCEANNIEYISFMHGDYLYSISFAFQQYTKYYTWDLAYNKMFKNLKCKSHFIVYLPKKLTGIAENIDKHECEYFATYYLSDETRESVEKIYQILNLFEKMGLRCKVRPHPRFSDINMLKNVFKNILIEDVIECSLQMSITNSLYIIGLNSTVLSEAFFSNKDIVIDDISMPDKYNELKEKEYIMLERPHMVFSDLIDKLKNNIVEYDNSYKFYHN